MREKMTDPVSIRMPPDLKAKLEALAAADRRSLSSYLVLALEAHVAAVEKKRRPKS